MNFYYFSSDHLNMKVEVSWAIVMSICYFTIVLQLPYIYIFFFFLGGGGH